MSSSIDQRSGPSPNRVSSQPSKKRIGEMLVEAGVINERQLNEAVRRQENAGGKMVDTLIYLGHMDSQQFIEFLSGQPGMPSISLKHCHISDEILELAPLEYVVRNEVFPIDRMGKLLTVGMVCPLDKRAISELEDITGLKVKPLLCSHREISDAISRYYHGDFFSTDARLAYRTQGR